MSPEQQPSAPAQLWNNRIVGYGQEDPKKLQANPFNFRTHPDAQRDALAGVLDRVGIVGNVTINKVTGRILDGHLRVSMAIAKGEPSVPVTYVELSEDEEKLVLAAFDQITALAGRDDSILNKLLADVRQSSIGQNLGKGLDALLTSLKASTGSQMPEEAPGQDDVPALPVVPVTRPGDMWLLDPFVECPHCGTRNKL